MRRFRRMRSYVLAFVLGFASCAVIVKLMLPDPVVATSVGNFTAGNPAEVVAAVGDSVVSIEIFPIAEGPGGVWPRLFGGSFDVGSEPRAVGSGVIITPEGHVVTNHHVIQHGGRIRVRLPNGREHDAEVVGSDPHTDLAVLKLPGGSYPHAEVGDSRRVRSGDSVVAIGNPLGFEHSVSVGVVSAMRQGPFRVDGRILGDMIQTDAAINQGNSGGGLFTADGRLVGINTATMVPRGGSGSIGIGFAIPVHRMQPVTEQLIAHGRVNRPWLGIRYQVPQFNGLVRKARSASGVLVEEVIPKSPAARAGLQPADIIRRLGDTEIGSADELQTVMERFRPGDEVPVQVLRGDQRLELPLQLALRPEE